MHAMPVYIFGFLLLSVHEWVLDYKKRSENDYNNLSWIRVKHFFARWTMTMMELLVSESLFAGVHAMPISR